MAKEKEAQQTIHPEVSDETVLYWLTDVLLQEVDLTTADSKWSDEEVAAVLTAAGAHGSSIEDTCNSLEEAPPARTVRHQLSQTLLLDAAEEKALERVETATNATLVTLLPPRLTDQPRDVAFDFNLQPYHGQAHEDENEIRRSQAKGGTTHFHCYASAYLMLRNKRVNLALTYVRAGETRVEVLQRLQTRVQELGITIRRLYADKEFCTVAVIRYLLEQDFASVIAAPQRGKTGGIKGRCHGLTRMEEYTMTSKEDGSVTFPLAIVAKNSAGKYNRHGRKHFAYAVLNGGPDEHHVYSDYRSRFGIESSYRLLNEGRGRTSSRQPALRLLFVALSLLMQNLWVWLKWHLTPPRRGGRDTRQAGCTFRRFRLLLVMAVRRLYRYIDHLTLPAGPLPDELRPFANC